MKLPLAKDIETGVGWQDKQHRELLDKIDSLIVATEDGRGAKELLRTIDFLDEYVVVHFHDEERAMAVSGYPDMAAHMERHHLFIEEISRLRELVEAPGAATTELAESIRLRVFEWLVDHICDMDKELASHIIRTRGVTAS